MLLQPTVRVSSKVILDYGHDLGHESLLGGRKQDPRRSRPLGNESSDELPLNNEGDVIG